MMEIVDIPGIPGIEQQVINIEDEGEEEDKLLDFDTAKFRSSSLVVDCSERSITGKMTTDDDSYNSNCNSFTSISTCVPTGRSPVIPVQSQQPLKFNLARSGTSNDLLKEFKEVGNCDILKPSQMIVTDFCVVEELDDEDEDQKPPPMLSAISSRASSLRDSAKNLITPALDLVARASGSGKNNGREHSSKNNVPEKTLKSTILSFKEDKSQAANLRTVSVGPAGGARASCWKQSIRNSILAKEVSGRGLTFKEFANGVLTPDEAKTIDAECYPEELSKLMDFLMSLKGSDDTQNVSGSRLYSLEGVVVDVLSVIPKVDSVLEQTLREHGWSSDNLKFDGGVEGKTELNKATIASLEKSLGSLLMTHASRQAQVQWAVGQSSGCGRARANSELGSDELVHKSYIPDILLIHLHSRDTCDSEFLELHL